MTTSTEARFEPVDPHLVPEAVATAELRAACEELGFPARSARIRFDGDGPVRRVVVSVPVDCPWRVTDAAVARALSRVRAVWPEVGFADRRFEDCRLVD